MRDDDGAGSIYLKKVVKENAEKLVQKMKDRVRPSPVDYPSPSSAFRRGIFAPGIGS